MVFRPVEKFSIWGIRFLQLCFAVILIGTMGWFMHQTHRAHWYTPREVSVTLGFSVIAMIISLFSIISVCFLSRTMQWVAAIIDLIVFIGYIVSAVLYRHNYHLIGWNNELRNYLIQSRAGNQRDSAHVRITNLVRLGAALIIIQIILFFITMLLSFMAARARDHTTTTTTHTGEKRSMFGRRRAHNVSAV